MRTITVRIPDEVYERVEGRAAARGATVDEVVVDLLERGPIEQDEERLAVARAHGGVVRFRERIPREPSHSA